MKMWKRPLWSVSGVLLNASVCFMRIHRLWEFIVSHWSSVVFNEFFKLWIETTWFCFYFLKLRTIVRLHNLNEMSTFCFNKMECALIIPRTPTITTTTTISLLLTYIVSINCMSECVRESRHQHWNEAKKNKKNTHTHQKQSNKINLRKKATQNEREKKVLLKRRDLDVKRKQSRAKQ